MWRLAAVIAVTVASAALFAAFRGSTPPGPTASEKLAALAVLTEDDMPGFTGGGGLEPCDAFTTGIYTGGPSYKLACSFSSFLTNEAYSGKGREQIDAQTRADGYDPETLHAPGQTPQPFTPIHGPFVTSHHGIFELYAPVTVLANPDKAHKYFLQQEEQTRGWELGVTEIPSSIGEESLTVKRPMGPDPTIFQTSFETVFRRGRVVVVLNTMGSPDLSVEENWRIANLIDGRIESGSGLNDALPTLTPEAIWCPLDERDTSGGFLVMLPSATTPLTPAIAAPLLASPDPALDALGLDRLFVSTSDDESVLPPGAEVRGPFYMTAADPDLHSCMGDLSDKPIAAGMRDEALNYLLEREFISNAQLSDAALNVDWEVSDDSLPNGLIAFYAIVKMGTPVPQLSQGEPDEYMVVFQGKSGPILGAAQVNLDAGFPAGPQN